MPKTRSLALSIALLTAYFQASYFHIHHEKASPHSKEHHLGQGLTVHTHLAVASHRVGHHPAIQSLPSHDQNDAIFLAWAPELPHFDLFLSSFPGEPKVLKPSDQVAYFILPSVPHSHDPPFVLSSAPRSPPA